MIGKKFYGHSRRHSRRHAIRINRNTVAIKIYNVKRVNFIDKRQRAASCDQQRKPIAASPIIGLSGRMVADPEWTPQWHTSVAQRDTANATIWHRHVA